MNHAIHLELEALLRKVHRSLMCFLLDLVLESLLQLSLFVRDLVHHILVGLLLVLVDHLLSDFLLQEIHLAILLQLATLVGLELVLALHKHSLLFVQSILSNQHLSLQLLLLADSAQFETPVRL